jgi:hypothetical protein
VRAETKTERKKNLTATRPLPTVPHPEHFCIFPGAQLRSQAGGNLQSRTTGSSVLHAVAGPRTAGRGSTKRVTVHRRLLSNNLHNSSNIAEISDCPTAIRQSEEGSYWTECNVPVISGTILQQRCRTTNWEKIDVLFYSYTEDFCPFSFSKNHTHISSQNSSNVPYPVTSFLQRIYFTCLLQPTWAATSTSRRRAAPRYPWCRSCAPPTLGTWPCSPVRLLCPRYP